MIRVLSRKLCTALNIKHVSSSKNISLVYPAFNEITSTTYNTDDGYRVLVDVCHETKTVYIDHDMSNYDELNDLPRIVKTFGCLYPNYTLRK
jgi:hypothetical protein